MIMTIGLACWLAKTKNNQEINLKDDKNFPILNLGPTRTIGERMDETFSFHYTYEYNNNHNHHHQGIASRVEREFTSKVRSLIR